MPEKPIDTDLYYDGGAVPLSSEVELAEAAAIETADLVAETVEEAARAIAEYAADLRKAADPEHFGPFVRARKLARDMEYLVDELRSFHPRDSVGVFVSDLLEDADDE